MNRFEICKSFLLSDVRGEEYFLSESIKRWGDRIGNHYSFIPKEKDILSFIGVRENMKKHNPPSLYDGVHKIEKYNLIQPNVFGLVIFEDLLIKGEIKLFDLTKSTKSDTMFILGLDKKENLFHDKHGYHVSCLQINLGNTIHHISLPLGSKMEDDEFTLAFEKLPELRC